MACDERNVNQTSPSLSTTARQLLWTPQLVRQSVTIPTPSFTLTFVKFIISSLLYVFMNCQSCLLVHVEVSSRTLEVFCFLFDSDDSFFCFGNVCSCSVLKSHKWFYSWEMFAESSCMFMYVLNYFGFVWKLF